MGDDLTAALFTGPELRGSGLGALMERACPDVVAGHGLGDLAALVAAQVLDHGDAIALARLREQLIACAAYETGGGLLAVVDPDAVAAAYCVATLSGVRIARHDSPARVVVAGTSEELRQARVAAEALDVAVERLAAPAPLHTLAMSVAAMDFAAALQRVRFRDAAVTVYSSVTAAPLRDPRAELAACLEAPVLWAQTIHALAEAGTTRFVEAGSPRTLGDLAVETLAWPEAAGRATDLVHAT